MTEVCLRGVPLQLLSGRGVFWPAGHTLFVADLHLGKDNTFRRNGLAVPRGVTSGTLGLVGRLIEHSEATRLVLLGDLFHDRASLGAKVCESVDRFRAAHRQLEIKLVRGNHDAKLAGLPADWEIEILEEDSRMGPFRLRHHPAKSGGEDEIVLAGHVHPAFRLQSGSDSVGRLPCFWYAEGCLVLPAIGEFTGSFTVRRRRGERIWVAVEESVLEV
jgi:DNA ligase-associated metallophosphoesterase